MSRIFYHGSSRTGLSVLQPFPIPFLDGEAVVFATPDPRFAATMIYGTGNQLAFGYYGHGPTYQPHCYIDELRPGALELLNNIGMLYQVSAAGFINDPRLMQEEYISRKSVPVLKSISIPCILNYLREGDVEITSYKDVPTAMEQRGQKVDQPAAIHPFNRFL